MKELKYSRIHIKRRLKTYARRLGSINEDIDNVIALLLEEGNRDWAVKFAYLAESIKITQDLIEKLAEEL